MAKSKSYRNKPTKTQENKQVLSEELKRDLAHELAFCNHCSDAELLEWCGLKKNQYTVNYKKIEGNRTHTAFYKAFEAILKQEGYDVLDFSTLEAKEIKAITRSAFQDLGIATDLLDFDASISGNAFDKQPYYQLWHLLYASDDDERLKETLCKKFGFKKQHTHHLLNIELQVNYGNVSAKAIKKILPHLQDGHRYDQACLLSGYNHSSSQTREETETRPLEDTIPLFKKNSLRNPVVEKILNQMIHIIHAVLVHPMMGRPDEIRIELAREVKASSEKRKEMTRAIDKATREHEAIRTKLTAEFDLRRVTRNDIICYKLWEETGRISIYTGKPIKASALFTKEYDIEHIIPKSRLFDDSFSNKTLCERSLNVEKGNKTAYSFLKEKQTPEDFEQYKARVKNLLGKISKTKYNKLLMTNDQIPEGFIERQLKETQYITKKAKELLETIVRKVTVTTGSITDRLRQDWELVDVLRELNWEKYHALGLTTIEKGKGEENLERIVEWSKRNDHRYHAMDALTVAFTKPVYIQYLNTLNALEKDGKKTPQLYAIQQKYLRKYKADKWRFIQPIQHFRQEAQKQLESILVSHKAKNKVATHTTNNIKIKGGVYSKKESTPRGPLHKETVYGSRYYYETKEEKVGSSFTQEKISTVAQKNYREALLQRLKAYGNDPKKAFTGKNALAKHPIYCNQDTQTVVPERVTLVVLQKEYTIRKPIDPELKIDKVIDVGIRRLLKNRLALFDGDPKKAFVHLDENPIWLHQEKGISIKRVATTGVTNAIPLHTKKDHLGKLLLDKTGVPIPVDFVSTGNNHHVAIYRDSKGNLHEEIVSFYEAVTRKIQGIPVVTKNHEKGWTFLFTMKQNECFVFPSPGFNPQDVDLCDPVQAARISKNLFRGQKIATKNYFFRHHLETTVEERKELKGIVYKNIQSLSPLNEIVKVRLNSLGDIVHIGE